MWLDGFLANCKTHCLAKTFSYCDLRYVFYFFNKFTTGSGEIGEFVICLEAGFEVFESVSAFILSTNIAMSKTCGFYSDSYYWKLDMLVIYEKALMHFFATVVYNTLKC